MRRFAFIPVLITAAVAAPVTASADRVVVSVGGGISVGAHAGVTVAVGGAAYHEPEPVYAPPPPAPVYQPPPAPPPPMRRRRTYDLGIGLRASSLEIKDAEARADGVGAVLRIRPASRRWELEFELGADQYVDSPRNDTRLGMSLYLHFNGSGSIHPYVVGGVGLNVIHFGDRADEHDPRQGYAELGGGLAFRVTDQLVISGDVRIQGRKLDTEDPAIEYQKRIVGLPERERTIEARLAGILYF